MNELGVLGLGSRLSRLSENLMKEVQNVYNTCNVDFDPYLFPVFKSIADSRITNTSEITQALAISQPGVTQFVNKLSDRGLIDQITDQTDKRKKELSLSEKGKELLTMLEPIWKAISINIEKLAKNQQTDLLTHIEQMETMISSGQLQKDILSSYKANQSEVEIIEYDPKYKDRFKDLNLEWLKYYFVVEPHDLEVLENPQTYILDKGGMIFFARYNDQIVGTVALMIEEHGVELSKMAVSPKFQGLKIGHKLMEACVECAKQKNWKTLILYSNSKLKPAIHLYKKFGFKHLLIEENSPYLRSDVKMLLDI